MGGSPNWPLMVLCSTPRLISNLYREDKIKLGFLLAEQEANTKLTCSHTTEHIIVNTLAILSTIKSKKTTHFQNNLRTVHGYKLNVKHKTNIGAGIIRTQI